jgi:hypothetical protein
MAPFFRRTNANSGAPQPLAQPVLPEHQYAWLRKQYRHFCNSKFNSMEMMEDDLKRLIAIPEVTELTFTTSDSSLSMVIGTSNLYITDPKTEKVYDIGEFVIVINRGQKTISFTNVTRVVSGGEGQNVCFHPHILAKVGEICMNAGRQQLNEHIGNGRIYDAVRILLKALQTTNGTPYLPVSYWPERK